MGVEIIGNTSLKVSVLEDMNNNYESVNYPEINTNYLKQLINRAYYYEHKSTMFNKISYVEDN